MPARNTPHSFGTVSRIFHWLTALLIFTAFPLGLIANRLPFDTSDALAEKALVFSLHKTLGVTIFFVALARILWALTERRPAPLHPDRRVETFAAETVHWLLYVSLVIVPLTGWVRHASLDGFAPIFWPFGQGLPFVPKSEAVSNLAASAHWLFTKLLFAAVTLHVAGALKHAVFDKDGTLARMVTGAPSSGAPVPDRSPVPPLLAFGIYAAGALLAFQLAQPVTGPNATDTPPPADPPAAGNWHVAEGTITFSVKQMGSKVEGSFATWTADIVFDEAASGGKNGSVSVSIDTTSLHLGTVTDQAKGPEFFDVAAHPTATFTADILPASTGYEAKGTLSLHGIERPVTLPFSLTIDGDTATMTGSTTLDRRDFGMGPSYPDESSIGFAVTTNVALTAQRVK